MTTGTGQGQPSIGCDLLKLTVTAQRKTGAQKNSQLQAITTRSYQPAAFYVSKAFPRHLRASPVLIVGSQRSIIYLVSGSDSANASAAQLVAAAEINWLSSYGGKLELTKGCIGLERVYTTQAPVLSCVSSK